MDLEIKKKLTIRKLKRESIISNGIYVSFQVCVEHAISSTPATSQSSSTKPGDQNGLRGGPLGCLEI